MQCFSRRGRRLAPLHSTGLATANPRIASRARRFSISPHLSRKDPAMPTRPPKHQMVHFPQLTSAVRAFGEFRKVLHTGAVFTDRGDGDSCWGGNIGDEVHTVDQTLLFTRGKCLATVASKQQSVEASDVVIVPAGTQHQFENVGNEPLELVTIYAPAEHNAQTVHQSKEEGLKEEEAGEDEPPYWSQKSKGENERMGLVKESGGPYEGE